MARWERVHVDPDFAGVTRAERVGGTYLRYHPDLLTRASNALSPGVTEYAADVSITVARLGAALRANPLPVLYSTALRSESIASSWIEGIRATPRDISIAQISDAAASHSAIEVARNVAAMKDAVDLLGEGLWTHEHLWTIHHELLPWQSRGYRTGQVWIGGTTKLNADYAAPPAGAVSGLVDDLLTYANTSGDMPLVLAAIVHAQFETIHPFNDGNGRTGRALVHGALKRAGLVDHGVIPLSTALRNDETGYVGALTAYRYNGDARTAALDDYVSRFLAYVETATVAAFQFADAAGAVHRRWHAAIAGVRTDAAITRAVDVVVENPVVSTAFLAEQLQLSISRASKLVRQLVEVGILETAAVKYRRSQLYQAPDILTLLSFGSEAGPRTPVPSAIVEEGQGSNTLVLRCGVSTAAGSCRNRVPTAGGRCWRHRQR